MKHNIYSVYDSKAKLFIIPFFLHNDDLAIRIFKECANSDQHMFGKHPADFVLYKVGTFDDNTAKIEYQPVIEQVALALELVENKQQQPLFDNMEVKQNTIHLVEGAK